MKYEEGILEEGYVGVKAYGICFCKKNLRYDRGK